MSNPQQRPNSYTRLFTTEAARETWRDVEGRFGSTSVWDPAESNQAHMVGMAVEYYYGR